MAGILGIDFGYSPATPSLGYIQFDTAVIGKEVAISVAVQAECSTLSEFKDTILASVCDHDIKLIALDAPITPARINAKPRSGRSIEKRFSRGDFNNGKRGPQPSSISVPKQGWELYCGAMDLMSDLKRLGYRMPLIERGMVVLTNKNVVEVCPKLTQSLLVPRARVAGRPAKPHTPPFYRQIDNWLFSHLFVPASPETPLAGDFQPTWGSDRTGFEGLLAAGIRIDQSVWNEAARIYATRPLPKRHELIGAFVAGLQGAMALAGTAVAVGASGDSEGYYVLPFKWHADWVRVWECTRRNGDCVDCFPIEVEAFSASPRIGKGV